MVLYFSFRDMLLIVAFLTIMHTVIYSQNNCIDKHKLFELCFLIEKDSAKLINIIYSHGTDSHLLDLLDHEFPRLSHFLCDISNINNYNNNCAEANDLLNTRLRETRKSIAIINPIIHTIDTISDHIKKTNISMDACLKHLYDLEQYSKNTIIKNDSIIYILSVPLKEYFDSLKIKTYKEFFELQRSIMILRDTINSTVSSNTKILLKKIDYVDHLIDSLNNQIIDIRNHLTYNSSPFFSISSSLSYLPTRGNGNINPNLGFTICGNLYFYSPNWHSSLTIPILNWYLFTITLNSFYLESDYLRTAFNTIQNFNDGILSRSIQLWNANITSTNIGIKLSFLDWEINKYSYIKIAFGRFFGNSKVDELWNGKNLISIPSETKGYSAKLELGFGDFFRNNPLEIICTWSSFFSDIGNIKFSPSEGSPIDIGKYISSLSIGVRYSFYSH
jgi:hypothetical protein